MISNAIMLGITVFLAVVLFAGVSVHDDGQHFFDMSNSNALRDWKLRIYWRDLLFHDICLWPKDANA